MTDGQIDTELQEELTLRLWDGDESVKGELILASSAEIEAAIRREFPALTETDAEDVVAESIRRFWIWRENYDPERAKISTVLYRIAVKVASEYRSGKYKWQKAMLREKGVAAEFFQSLESTLAPPVDDADETDEPDSQLGKAVKRAVESLPDIQQDILRAYADAGDYPLDAAVLGRDLGNKYKGGVPIPAGTIRVYKNRGKEALTQRLSRDGFDLNKMGYLHD